MSGKNSKLILGLIVAVILAGILGINAYIASMHKAEDALDRPDPSAPQGTAKSKTAPKPGASPPSDQ